MNQDTRQCFVAFNGQTTTQGDWQITVASVGSSNGTEISETFSIHLGDADGIEEVKNVIVNGTSSNSKYIYDLSGRQIEYIKLRNGGLPKGLYIQQSRKILIK